MSTKEVSHRGGQSQQSQQSGAEDCCQTCFVIFSYFWLIVTFPCSVWCCIKYVQEYERAVIFRMGRLLKGARGPGIFFVLPCIDTIQKVDLRLITFDVPPQQILTKDSVTMLVDAVVYFRVFNSVLAVTKVENVFNSTRLLAQTMLRNVLGTKSLHEILIDRDQIVRIIQSQLAAATTSWGVKVDRVEMKNIQLPVEMQRAMAAEAESAREAKAKVIAAEGEQKASKALAMAADVIAQSPGAIQLRYLQTLTQISGDQNDTIVFPLPMDIIQEYLRINRSRTN